MGDPCRVDNDSFQDVLLILRQVTLRTQGRQGGEEVAPAVAPAAVLRVRRQDARQCVEIAPLAPSVKKQAEWSGSEKLVSAGPGLARRQAPDLALASDGRPG
jgi:hypothetical protein